MGSEIAFWYVRERSLLGCGGAIAVGECGEWAIVLIMRVLEGRSLFWGMWGDVRNAIAEMKIVV